MKRPIAIAFALSALSTLGGCATELTPQGSRIKILKQDDVAYCRQVKYISVSLPIGTAADAQRKALNETAEAGGDSIYIYFTWSDPMRGSQVQGEAVRCNLG